MDEARLRKLLEGVRSGTVKPGAALETLRDLPCENLDFARVDHHRALRQGIPEVVFAAGKSPEDTGRIAVSLFSRAGKVLITRCSPDHVCVLERSFPAAARLTHHSRARCVTVVDRKTRVRPAGSVLVLTAGTSDGPVAEEALVTLGFLGSRGTLISDVGVAGIHRLTEARGQFKKSRVIIVTAGMEGALPSVVGGITDRPVIGVPTSVGYGTSFGGLTALFAMLNSCVPGIAVVNVDNGFGAACLAHRINTQK